MQTFVLPRPEFAQFFLLLLETQNSLTNQSAVNLWKALDKDILQIIHVNPAVQILLRTYCCFDFPNLPDDIGQFCLVLLLMKKLFVSMLRQ